MNSNFLTKTISDNEIIQPRLFDNQKIVSCSWLIERLETFQNLPAFIANHKQSNYEDLLIAINEWLNILQAHKISLGECVGVYGDYSPNVCALILALILNGNIIVPLTPAVDSQKEKFLKIAQVGYRFEFTNAQSWSLLPKTIEVTHPLIKQLQSQKKPGLILFSSGSTGESKASLLNLDKLLEKLKKPRRGYCTLAFLLLDHIGGLNTLLHSLSQGGTVVTIEDRTPETICSAIERHQIQLLPTTPTFLKMILISEAYKKYDLSSLELITYGTEPMSLSTLRHLHEVLPNVMLKQTYGLSEVGILPTQSKEPDSLWLKLGSQGFEHKVIDNILWIRADSAMLGYLNAPSPFDEEGWFNTGDVVEIDGEYLRILGRKSEIINVGGEKVYPTEVENVILQMSNIRDVTVMGKPNPVTGQVVVAQVSLLQTEDIKNIKKRLRSFCKDYLEPYKIPVEVEILDGEHHNKRFKKIRFKHQ